MLLASLILTVKFFLRCFVIIVFGLPLARDASVAFLFVAIACLLVWSAQTADEGCAVGSHPSKSHIGRFVLHIPLKEGEAIANAAQGGVVLLKVNLMHPAKSFSLSR